MLKNKKGITLVALIITVVVLLILAVVAIQEIVGDGIITHAINAVEKHNMSQIKEEVELIKIDAQTEYFITAKTLTQAELLRIINEHFEGSTIEGNAVILENGKYKIVVDENLNITVEKTEEDGTGEATPVRGDVELSSEVNLGQIKLTVKLLGIPVYDDELLYTFLETDCLANKSTEELIVMLGDLYTGSTMSPEAVYNAMYKSEFNISYQEFMDNKDALVQQKFGVPTANIAIKMLILEKTTGENYGFILDWMRNVQYAREVLPELVGKSETEIGNVVEGWVDNAYTFEQIMTSAITEQYGEGVTLDQVVMQLNAYSGLEAEEHMFVREDGVIFIAAQAYAQIHPILISSNINVETSDVRNWFMDTVIEYEYYYSTNEAGNYTFIVTAPSGNTKEETVNVVFPSIELDKTEITKTDTLTAILTNLDASKLVWTTSNDSVAVVEGTGTSVNVVIKSAGEAIITATCGSYSATCKVKVKMEVTLDKTEITKGIKEGGQESETLTAILTNLDASKLVWTTSNDSVAIVEGTGTSVNIVLKSVGKAIITATCGEYSATCEVKVGEYNEEVIVPTIQATGNFANNPNIAEVREGNVPIPTGYTYVKGNVDGGVVIKDSSGNEWVWVPATVSEISEVVNGKNVGKLYSFTNTGANARTYPITQNSGCREPDVVTGASSGSDSTIGNAYDAANLSIVLEGEYAKEQTAASFKAQLQVEFDNMIESVSLYGGYYIGRYEAGGSINSPVLQQGATVIRDTSDSSNWYYMYTSAKKLAANDSVTTGMIWGCQWDNTLRWLVSSNNLDWTDLRNSSGWGNYMNSTGNAATNSGTKRSAGYSEYWKAGNIYDLAGNYGDWTLEVYNSDSRVLRGNTLGNDYGSGSPASVRGVSNPTDTDGCNTFRPTLIIE